VVLAQLAERLAELLLRVLLEQLLKGNALALQRLGLGSPQVG
jgi:hypothetical protein